MAKKRQYANSNPVRLNPVSFEMIEEKLKKIKPGRKITICKGKLDMITTEEVEVISSDEKVKETKTQVTYDYSDYVSDMYPISYYKDYIKNSNKFYKDINGVKASLKVKGNKVIYTVDIQYDSDYMKDLVEAELVSTNGSYKDIEYISLQDTLKNQENAGLTCKEK